jgi:hypothetical protein
MYKGFSFSCLKNIPEDARVVLVVTHAAFRRGESGAPDQFKELWKEISQDYETKIYKYENLKTIHMRAGKNPQQIVAECLKKIVNFAPRQEHNALLLLSLLEHYIESRDAKNADATLSKIENLEFRRPLTAKNEHLDLSESFHNSLKHAKKLIGDLSTN